MLQAVWCTLKGINNVVGAVVVGVGCKALVGAHEHVDTLCEDGRGVGGAGALRQVCPLF